MSVALRGSQTFKSCGRDGGRCQPNAVSPSPSKYPGLLPAGLERSRLGLFLPKSCFWAAYPLISYLASSHLVPYQTSQSSKQPHHLKKLTQTLQPFFPFLSFFSSKGYGARRIRQAPGAISGQQLSGAAIRPVSAPAAPGSAGPLPPPAQAPAPAGGRPGACRRMCRLPAPCA